MSIAHQLSLRLLLTTHNGASVWWLTNRLLNKRKKFKGMSYHLWIVISTKKVKVKIGSSRYKIRSLFKLMKVFTADEMK